MTHRHSLQTYHLLSDKRDLKGRTIPYNLRVMGLPNHEYWRQQASRALRELARIITPDYAHAVQDAVRRNPDWTWRSLAHVANTVVARATEDSLGITIDNLLDAVDLQPANDDPDGSYWACKAMEGCAYLAGVAGEADRNAWLDEIGYQDLTWREITRRAEHMLELAEVLP